ncbi:MAG: hypothetical protein FK734_15740 [Asgard group archaeon]|nr:hypothetical protein [Asgard group archaeon]
MEIKKKEEWAVFFIFFGGILLIANSIFGLIVGLVMNLQMPFLDGVGWLTFKTQTWAYSLGGSLNILFGIVGLLIGLKLFSKIFYNILVKIDLAIIGIVVFIFGLASFSIPGLIMAVGGIYCFIYRLTVEGANNPMAK